MAAPSARRATLGFLAVGGTAAAAATFFVARGRPPPLHCEASSPAKAAFFASTASPSAAAGVPRVVVVGGAFAGLSTAEALHRRLGPRAQVVLVEERDSFFNATRSLHTVLKPSAAGFVWTDYWFGTGFSAGRGGRWGGGWGGSRAESADGSGDAPGSSGWGWGWGRRDGNGDASGRCHRGPGGRSQQPPQTGLATSGATSGATEPASPWPSKAAAPAAAWPNEASAARVRGRAVSISDDRVELADGTVIPFDYAVVATGTWNPPPGKARSLTRADGAREAAELYAALGRARSVAVVGGGQVGVELAAELSSKRPDLHVTLVHRSGELLSRMAGSSSAFRARVRTELEKLPNLQLALGRTVAGGALGVGAAADDGVRLTPQTLRLRTADGGAEEEVQADVTFLTTGNRPNSDFVVRGLGTGAVDAGGYVVTGPDGRLPGHARLFAAGDVSTLDATKKVHPARAQAQLVAGNIVALVEAANRGTGDVRLAEYSAQVPNRRKVKLGSHGTVFEAFGFVAKM
ncbi:hypothetical protein HK405_006303 [Cladochytrium tenue]|nr:hypothetical protein HK405_006303 [Cladochytrium tenue]